MNTNNNKEQQQNQDDGEGEWRPRWQDREALRRMVVRAKAYEWIRDPQPGRRVPSRIDGKRKLFNY